MPTSNLLLDNADILSNADDFALIYRDGTVLLVRATRAFLKESPAQLGAAFSESGLNVWTSVPPTQEQVEFVRMPSTGLVHRVIDREVTGAGERACRFQLQPEASTDDAFATLDWHPDDFSRLDFA